MDKRSYSLVVSPHKVPEMENCKKFKLTISPKKENIVNSLNNEIHDQLDGLCFDDDDDEFFNTVRLHLIFNNQAQLKTFFV